MPDDLDTPIYIHIGLDNVLRLSLKLRNGPTPWLSWREVVLGRSKRLCSQGMVTNIHIRIQCV